MSLPFPLPDLPADTQLRSGTAARLAGLPATTLRVWERRYGVVAAPKTFTGQRLYSVSDVRRLALLRQLTTQGHAIGTIAGMTLEALLGLAATAADAARAAPPAPGDLQVVAVGPTIAARLAGSRWADALRAHADLDGALAAGGPASGGLPRHLLVEAPALTPALTARLRALARDWGVGATVVYRFGPASAVAALRADGVQVLREPVAARALRRRLDEVARAAAAPAPAAVPRRFSDADLARLASLPSAVRCECPRHLAEIVAQLAGFERYSADCGDAHPADAALHRRLHALAAETRARFEQALAEVAAAEGLTSPGA
jgi:hypothetical protein